MAKKVTAVEKATSLRIVDAAVMSLGIDIDALERFAKPAGLKIHAETFKALHRHQKNLRDMVARLQEVANV